MARVVCDERAPERHSVSGDETVELSDRRASVCQDASDPAELGGSAFIEGRNLTSTSSLAAVDHIRGMGKQAAVVLYVLVLVAVVVGVDILFFRHQFWERLAVNVGIVLGFAALYFRFLHRS
jgi:hypothetical protein